MATRWQTIEAAQLGPDMGHVIIEARRRNSYLATYDGPQAYASFHHDAYSNSKTNNSQRRVSTCAPWRRDWQAISECDPAVPVCPSLTAPRCAR